MRDFKVINEPVNMSSFETTTDWINWADREGLIPPVATRIHGACRMCFGAVEGHGEGAWYERCWNCRTKGYESAITGLFPIAYSHRSGLESVLHKYKDWDNYQWLSVPLASVLWEFLNAHLSCIAKGTGPFDVATAVPSGDSTRGWDPLAKVIASVERWPVAWDLSVLLKAKPGRPGRAQVDPEYYSADAAKVNGANVLLLDDVWTTGASAVSAARCLRDAGAKHVAVVTLGRQLTAGYGSADDLIAVALDRSFQTQQCVNCG